MMTLGITRKVLWCDKYVGSCAPLNMTIFMLSGVHELAPQKFAIICIDTDINLNKSVRGSSSSGN